jgi:putative heme-binding domain-containing protein
MYQSVDVVEPELLEKLLHAQDGRIRAAAVRVLSSWSSRVTNGFNLLAERVADEHPRVRLEVMRALGKIPTARSADLVLSALSRPMDDFLDYGLWLSINDLARPWIDSILSDNWKPEGHERELEFGLKSVEPALASKVFTKLVAGKPIPATGNWIELIGQAGSPNELRQLFDQVLQGGFDEASTARALTALNEAARLRKAKPAGDLAGLGNLLQNSGSKAGVAAVRLVGTWKLKPFASQLVNLAQSQSAPAKLAQAAIESLREIGGAEAIEGLRALAEKGSDLTLRRQAVVALAALDLNKSLPQIMAIASATTQPDEAVGLWRALLSIKGAAPALARALPKTGFPPDAAKAGLRVARESGRNEPDLVLALSRAGNLEDESQNLTPAEIQALVAKMKSADPARGEIIFRRKDLSCTVCHAIGGAGGKVGPDLTSLGASAPPDYLIESVLAPNKTVKEGYHSIQVQTKDGQEFSGVLVRETSQELILRDATNKEVSIPKNNIDERRLGGSLMPSGMVDNLTSEERLDLFRFLSELGKPGPYDASQANVARVWKLRPGTHTIEQFGEEKFVNNDPNGAEWQPTYSLADGRLLRDQLHDGAKAGQWIGVVGLYAATQLQVAKAGPVSLKFSGAANAPVWIDGKPATGGSEVSPNLAAGIHTIVVRLDPKKLPDHLRLESSDGTFLAN